MSTDITVSDTAWKTVGHFGGGSRQCIGSVIQMSVKVDASSLSACCARSSHAQGSLR